MRGPIAFENNPPINPQYYAPSVFNISAITLGITTTVTTTANHNYVTGQLVRLVIPSIYGSSALNERSAYVLSVPAANQVILSLYSLNSDPFTANLTSGTTQPQILAIGDINTGVTNSSGRSPTGTFIPGSFIDISPL